MRIHSAAATASAPDVAGDLYASIEQRFGSCKCGPGVCEGCAFLTRMEARALARQRELEAHALIERVRGASA